MTRRWVGSPTSARRRASAIDLSHWGTTADRRPRPPAAAEHKVLTTIGAEVIDAELAISQAHEVFDNGRLNPELEAELAEVIQALAHAMTEGSRATKRCVVDGR